MIRFNFKHLIKCVVVTGLIYYLVYQSFREFRAHPEIFDSVRWPLLIASFLIFLLVPICYVFIWQRITGLFGCPISLRAGTYCWSVSELGKYIPGKFWLYLGKTYYYRKAGHGLFRIILSMLIEGIGLIIAQFIIGSFLVFLSKNGTVLVSWVGFLLAAALVLALLNPKFVNLIAGKLSINGSDRSKVAIRAKDIFEIILLYLFSTMIVGMAFVLLVFAFKSVGFHELFYLTGVFFLSCAIGSISFIAPAGLGVRDGLFLFWTSHLSHIPIPMIAIATRVLMILTECLFIGFIALTFKNTKMPHQTLNSLEGVG